MIEFTSGVIVTLVFVGVLYDILCKRKGDEKDKSV